MRVGEIFDSTELAEVREALGSLGGRIDEMVSLLGRIDGAMDAICEAGMYKNAPAREAWESRGGNPNYLYLYWGVDRMGRNGSFLGPGGKKKLYIGSDPAKIADARRKAENQRRYSDLQGRRQEVSYWFMAIKRDMDDLMAKATRTTSEGGSFITDNRELPQPANPAPILARTCEEVKERLSGSVSLEQAVERQSYPSEEVSE